MKLRLSPRALRDLQQIGAYLYPRNPSAAVTVRAGIRKQLQVLIEYPESGRPIGRGLRRSVLPRLPYLIVYRVDQGADTLFVATIRHAARRELT